MDEPQQKLSVRDLNLSAVSLLAVTVVVCVSLSLTRETFWSYNNIYSILYGVSIEFFAILGFTYLMIMGEIDLSVGSVYAFSGIFAGYLMTLDVPIWLAVLLALVACGLIGLVNGWLVVKFRLNSLMVTIGMMILVRGLVGILTIVMVGSTFSRSYRAIARAKIENVNVTIIAMLLLVPVLELLLRKSVHFKKLYYIGENLDSALIYGMRAAKIKIMTFAAASVTAGIGGVLAASRITHADVTTGKGLEFKVVTAAVLGGASLFGGKGSIVNSVLGLIFLAIVLNGMVMFDIEPVLQQLVMGVILIAAVFVDTLLSREKLSQ